MPYCTTLIADPIGKEYLASTKKKVTTLLPSRRKNFSLPDNSPANKSLSQLSQ